LIPIIVFTHDLSELKYTSLIKMIILKENFKWHLEAFASELFICTLDVLECHPFIAVHFFSEEGLICSLYHQKFLWVFNFFSYFPFISYDRSFL